MKWRTWLRARVKDKYAREGDIPLPPLGAITGQDARALTAIAACWELYSNSDEAGAQAALHAARALLHGMQPQCRPFARELIAFALDWHDRQRVWELVHGTDYECARLERSIAAELEKLDVFTSALRRHNAVSIAEAATVQKPGHVEGCICADCTELQLDAAMGIARRGG